MRVQQANEIYSFVGESLASIFRACDLENLNLSVLGRVDPELLTEFTRQVFPEFKNNPGAGPQFAMFLDAVSVGSISPAEWMRRILQVYSWLAGQNKTAKFSDVFQYINCSLGMDGSECIVDVLEFYGFERAMPRKSLN